MAVTRPTPKAADVHGPEVPVPPLIAANARAAAYWTSYTREGVRGGLSVSDLPLLARLCIALALADEATEGVARTGLLIRQESGPPITNPLIGVMTSQTELASRLAQRLELSLNRW